MIIRKTREKATIRDSDSRRWNQPGHVMSCHVSGARHVSQRESLGGSRMNPRCLSRSRSMSGQITVVLALCSYVSLARARTCRRAQDVQ